MIRLALLLLACGAPQVPDAGLPPYTGQERCECRDLGAVREPHRFVGAVRCDAYWGCGLDATDACRVVCAWGGS